MEHTPGPWGVIRSTQSEAVGNWTVYAGIGYPVATCLDRDSSIIAAAPDMLTALHQIESLSRTAERGKADVSNILGDIARAAIAKAEGEA